MSTSSFLAKTFGLAAILWILPTPVFSHFLTLIPLTDMASSSDDAAVHLEISFMHPCEGERMDMTPPKRFAAQSEGTTQDLEPSLAPHKDDKNRWYSADSQLKRPGDHIFFVDPAPYWEPAQETFIVNQTKVVVDAFGLEEGWDQPVGLKAEILPLTRPYGLWEGNLFTGQVLFKGEPVPSAEVEVTLNKGEELIGDVLPAQRIQVVKADQNGVFSCAMPKAGWWGFAALLEDDRTLPGPDGKPYPVELGAVI